MQSMADALAAQQAAQAINRVRAQYGNDLSRLEKTAPSVERDTILPLYRAIFRELGRAATLVSTGRDPGDAGVSEQLLTQS